MDKNRIRFLMATLTLIDIIIVSIFLLILPEQSTDKKTIMGASSKTTGDTVFEDVEMESEDSIISEPVVSINEDFQGNYSDSVLDIFQSKIIGKWVISDTMVYEFGEGGTFNGFLTVNIQTLQDILIICLCQIRINHIYLYIIQIILQ